MSIAALAFVKDDGKKIGAFIKDAATIYQKRDDYLQMAGVISVYHAAQHGDPVFIQQFFDALSKGHKNMFRAWLAKLTAYDHEGAKGWWLGFKDEKFFVKPSTENIRKGSFDNTDGTVKDALLSDLWMKKPAVTKPALDENGVFNELMVGVSKRITAIQKAFADAQVTIPKELNDAIRELEAVIVKVKK